MKTEHEHKHHHSDPAAPVLQFEVSVCQEITVGSYTCHRVVKWLVPAANEQEAAANYYKVGTVVDWKQLD